MAGHDKWIRSIRDNPAGKVVADPEGNRWEWDRATQEDTSRLLRRLHNDELAIEQSDIVPNPLRRRRPAAAKHTESRAEKRAPDLSKPSQKSSGRDEGGGFNPYDSSGKARRR